MRVFLLLIFAILISNSVFAQEVKKNEVTKESIKHLKLYPKEADKYVNIYVEFEEPEDFTLQMPATSLNDEKKWDLKAKSSYQTSMSVTNLPDGEYTIMLNYRGIEEKESFKVKRK